MKKTSILIFFISLYSCRPYTPASLKESKEYYLETVYSDTVLTQRAEQSGVLEKIQNTKTKDSLQYYWEELRLYVDSMDKSNQ